MQQQIKGIRRAGTAGGHRTAVLGVGIKGCKTEFLGVRWKRLSV